MRVVPDTDEQFSKGSQSNLRVHDLPVSTIPAVVDKIVSLAPYLMDWLIPQNSLAGEVVVIGLIRNYQSWFRYFSDRPKSTSDLPERYGTVKVRSINPTYGI